MKSIKSFELNQDETVLGYHENMFITVRKPGSSYTRIGVVHLTNKRLVVIPSSKRKLGGSKDVIEIDYLEISAIRTRSEFDPGGIALYCDEQNAVHLGFFRNHFWACRIFLFIALSVAERGNSVTELRSILMKITIDAYVPNDFDLDSGILNYISIFGIEFRKGAPISFGGRSKGIEDAKGVEKENRAISSTSEPKRSQELESYASGYRLRVKKCLAMEGEYVQQNDELLIVETQDGRTLRLRAPINGYFHVAQNLADGWFHSSETLFRVLKTKPTMAKQDQIKTAYSETAAKSVGQYLSELESMIGLKSVKEEVKQLVNLIEIQQERASHGMHNTEISYHMVFLGSPGTGKTTVARVLGKIFKGIGLLSKGHFIEVDRAGLVGGYLGQTAIKTMDVLQSAMGGVLFIDEAYSLSLGHRDDIYGREAIDVILKFMEDNRNDFLLVVAGYDEPMCQFLESNPGLKSRFNTFLHFEDYNRDELLDIFLLLTKNAGYQIDETCLPYINDMLLRVTELKGKDFGNGRSMRNLLEVSIRRQASRLVRNKSRTKNDLYVLTRADFSQDDVHRITR